jgi:glycosyltransferase involved in cell wall biosynthesis
LKILFVDHSSALGGGQLGLRRYLDYKSPHERSLLLLEDGPLAVHARNLGIQVELMRGGATRVGTLALGRSVRHTIRRCDPDVVVTNSLRVTNLLGVFRTADHPYIAYLREDLSHASLSGIKRPLMMNGTLQHFDAFLANSLFTAGTIPRTLASKPLEIAYPVSGINPENPKKRRVHGRPVGVLSLSRLAQWKGIHVLLEAAVLLSKRGLADKFDFVIAGEALFEDPHYKVRLKSIAARSSASFRFLGHVNDPLTLLRDNHILAHCSVRPEPYGQVIPQGMIHGLATIATHGGGPAEMITDSVDGFLVRPEDPEALADRLAELASSAALLTAIGEQGRASAVRFLDTVTAPALDRAIESLYRKVTRG